MTTPWTEGEAPPAPPAAPAPPRRRGGFWRGLGKFLLWSFATLGFLVFLGGLLALLVISQFDSTPSLPDGPVILTVDLNRGVAERTGTDLGLLAGNDDSIPLRPLIDALELAAIDPQVIGVALNLGGTGMDLARAQDVRNAIEGITDAGKPVYAFAPSFGLMSPGTVDYYLASVASEIWLAPYGDLNLIGLAIEAPFVGEALSELDVTVQIGQREEYKSAVETFTRTGFSGPARESQQQMLDSMLASIVDGIATGRDLTPDEVRVAIDAPPMSAEAAQVAGLIDRIDYDDAFFTALGERHLGATLAGLDTYLGVVEPLGTPQANVAYIQALGPVTDVADDRFDTSVVAPNNVGLALASALEDPTIDAVVLRIDSPGGTYTGSDAIWRQVVRLREAGKPVVASMGSMAASGGYYIAMGADRIVAQPGTITGSIGIFAGKVAIDAATGNYGITWDHVTAGANAGMYSWTQAFTPAQWQAMNETLDRLYEDFVHKAAAGRRMGFDAMEQLAGGRVWSGADAQRIGLVDALGGPSEAFAEVRDLLGLPADAPLEVRVLPPVRSPLEELMDLFQDPAAGVSLQVELPGTLSDWPELLDIMDGPGALLRLPPMRIEG